MGNNVVLNKTLKMLSDKLNSIDYAFIGSADLYIQGANSEPRDIDILTTAAGIKEINLILGTYQTKPIYFDESEGRNSLRSFYKIDGFEIEVLANINNIYRKPESLNERIFIEFGRVSLPCIPLESELTTYKGMGRTDKVKLIEKFIKERK